MKFVANRINQTHLRDILPVISEDVQVDNVLAAIAYGRNGLDESKNHICPPPVRVYKRRKFL